jgi:N-acetylmuramoyl-L-alanine amidase
MINGQTLIDRLYFGTQSLSVMMKIWQFIPIFFLTVHLSLSAQNDTFIKYRPHRGETISSILQKYHLPADRKSIKTFYQINGLEINEQIYTHKIYNLPILSYTYNGKSIRSTIDNSNWDLAVKIQTYNLELYKDNIKSGDYRRDNELWVPVYFLHSNKAPQIVFTSNTKMLEMPIFGEAEERFPQLSEKLKNRVYYLVAGHGGPDPGAMSKYKNHDICEDEYSYDVTLRLAKLLLQHGATVEIIVKDPGDGIRSQKYLPCDHDEVTPDGRPLPLNQLKRLQQRSDVINKLYIDYRKNHKYFKEHTAIMIHVDSRNKSKRQDVYFYHLPDSKKGKGKATSLYQTFKNKYEIHRKNGNYRGSVSGRNLFMLRSTYPPAVFIELGNLKNPRDQKRILLERNRQALAKWMFEGLVHESI